MSHPDWFDKHAEAYAEHRPTYPDRLFELVAEAAKGCDRVWDCATGNGQAAVALARFFDEVVATDVSENQLAAAVPHERVSYRCEPAEATSLTERSVDAVTIAAALHWVDRSAFYAEVRRVARPGAVLAAWTYSARTLVSPAIDAVLERLVSIELGSYWAPAFHHVQTGYRELPFPFETVAVPALAIEVEWTLGQLLGHVETWSASMAYRSEQGHPATDRVREPLLRAWGAPDRVRSVALPLSVRVGRVTPPVRSAA